MSRLKLIISRIQRPDFTDAVAVLLLSLCALVGFRRTYGGWQYLVVGMIGAVAGVVLAIVVRRVRAAAFVSLAIVLVGFFVIGAPSVAREDVVAGFIPTPAAFTGLADGLVTAWSKSLTTLPPAGTLGNLLAVPYVCGFAAGLVSMLLAGRRRARVVLVALPALVLVASLLFGTRTPFSPLLQGAGFVAVAISWWAVRYRQDQAQLLRSAGHKRGLAAVAMVGVICGSGLAVAPRLPGYASDDQRTILRAEPPYDLRQFGSPLAAFQRYGVKGASEARAAVSLKDKVLFTVQGLPAEPLNNATETYISMAVMDDYDGVVWRVSGDASAAGRFERIGDTLNSDSSRPTVKANIKFAVRDLPGMWMPVVGDLRAVSWQSPRADDLRRAFRLSQTTGTAIVPIQDGWQPGDSYTLTVALADPLTEADVKNSQPAVGEWRRMKVDVPEALKSLAGAWTKGKVSTFDQAHELERRFRLGYLTTGEQNSINAPGHSLFRLGQFVSNETPIGNAEQYAATMAVMLRSLDIPARVVMGFKVQPSADGSPVEVLGSSVHAWVEVAFEGQGWMVFDPTSTNAEKPKPTEKKPRPRFESQDLPPPPVIPPEPDVNVLQGKDAKAKEAKKEPPPIKPGENGSGFNLLVMAGVGVVGLPIVGLGCFGGVVTALKRRRTRRRRRAVDPSTRLAGGWLDYVDTASDARLPMMPKATRRELGQLIGTPESELLAARADEALFGVGVPADDLVEDYWSTVTESKKSIKRSLPVFDRIRAALSVASLRKRP